MCFTKSITTAELGLLYEPSYSPKSSVITPGLLQREIDIKQPCPHIKNSPFGEVFPGPRCSIYSKTGNTDSTMYVGMFFS